MKIALNALYYRDPPTGISRYTQQLMEWLPRIDASHEYFFFISESYKSSFTSSPVIPIPLPATFSLKRTFRETHIFKALIKKYAIELFHSPHFLLPVSLPCARVITVHDMAVFEFPGFFPIIKRIGWNWRVPRSTDQANHIIADSEAIKIRLHSFLPNLNKPMTVIPLGIDTDTFHSRSETPVPQIGLREKYILFVGIISPRKNLIRLLRAFQILVRNYFPGHHLVLIGDFGFWEKPYIKLLHGLIKQYGLAAQVHLFHNVDDDQLHVWYRNADMLVHPALGEGFGLPVLEAMALGTPVAVADHSSLPELVGDAGILFDPFSEDSMVKAMITLLRKNHTHQEYSRKGVERSKLFTWENTARKTLAVYEETLSSF